MKFFKYFTVRKPDFVILKDNGLEYMKRWFIIPRNRFFNIYLHHIMASDDERALHDHMYWNISILLKSVYLEHFEHHKKWRVSPSIILRKPETLHRIELTRNEYGIEIPTWSLFITGPRVRDWGFKCPQGWRNWREFVKSTDTGNTVGKGCN
jgi:hypothetical protein